jgi:ketosteroid isomerase-like protein
MKKALSRITGALMAAAAAIVIFVPAATPAQKRDQVLQETTMKKAYSETEKGNLKIISDGFDRWIKGTGSPFDLLATDAKWKIVGNSAASKQYNSRQEFIDEVITPFNARMARRLIPKTPILYADGDTVIALFDAEGTALDGKPYQNTYSWFMRLRDGRIVDATAFFDSVHFNDFWTRVTPPAQK